jgi:ATP-dependent RNA helicase DHX57
MGSILGCRQGALAMAAGISVGRSPFLRIDDPSFNRRRGGSNGEEESFEEMKNRRILEERAKLFKKAGNSDHAMLAGAYLDWENLDAGGGKRKQYCETLGLSWNGMRDILKLVNQLDASLRSAGYAASKESDRNAHSLRILRACAVSSMAPGQLVRVHRPSTKYVDTAEGALEKDGKAKELKFFIRPQDDPEGNADPRSKEERVFMHPSSANFAVGNYSCPWLVYHSMVRTSKSFLRDATECSAYALLLFGGQLDVQARNGVIVVDDWVKLSANARIGALIRGLREKMDDLLAQKIKDPNIDIANSTTANLVVKLLITDGLGN